MESKKKDSYRRKTGSFQLAINADSHQFNTVVKYYFQQSKSDFFSNKLSASSQFESYFHEVEKIQLREQRKHLSFVMFSHPQRFCPSKNIESPACIKFNWLQDNEIGQQC